MIKFVQRQKKQSNFTRQTLQKRVKKEIKKWLKNRVFLVEKRVESRYFASSRVELAKKGLDSSRLESSQDSYLSLPNMETAEAESSWLCQVPTIIDYRGRVAEVVMLTIPDLTSRVESSQKGTKPESSRVEESTPE